MINQSTEIDHYQALLFVADSFDHLFSKWWTAWSAGAGTVPRDSACQPGQPPWMEAKKHVSHVRATHLLQTRLCRVKHLDLTKGKKSPTLNVTMFLTR